MPSLTDIVRKLYDEMWSWGNQPPLAEIFHPEFIYRGSLGAELIGHDQFENFINNVLRAMPDFHCEILEITAQDTRVIVKLRYTGSHRGELLGFAPTGKRISWLGSAHFTFQDGLMANLWAVSDVHGLVHQLAANQSELSRTIN